MAVTGISALRQRLARLRGGVGAGMRARADDLAIELLGRSQAVAPELTRRLVKSGRITKQDSAGRVVRVVSYNTPYAVKQHEHATPPGGPITRRKAATQDGPAGRKFLERPFNNMRRGIILALGAVPENIARRRL